MNLPGNQIALLHQRREGCSQRKPDGHGDAHEQVRPHEQLAVVEVGDGHATEGAEHHHGQHGTAIEVMALGELPFDQGLAGFGVSGAGFLGLDAQKHRVATKGQQRPHRQGMQEVEIEREALGHGRGPDQRVGAKLIQCRKWRRPVVTIARPSSSQAAIESASRTLPPG